MWHFFSRALPLSPLCLNVYAINHKAPTTKNYIFEVVQGHRNDIRVNSLCTKLSWLNHMLGMLSLWPALAIQILVSINLIIIAFLIENSEHSCVAIIAMIAFMLTRLALRITYEMNHIIHSTTIHKYTSGHMCACFGHRLLILLFSCLSPFINSNA